MSNPYVGEIRMFAGNFAPQGWAICDGSLQSIADNPTLFTLIGTTYGGDGQNTFALPDLRGRVPIHQGNTFVIGQPSGSETVTLSAAQIPPHNHPGQGQSADGNQPGPAGGVWATSSLAQFSSNVSNGTMSASAVQAAGGSQPHNNMMPYVAINFIISLFGIFPSQS